MHPASPQNGRVTTETILAELEQHVGDRNLEHWFRGRTVLAVEGDELRIGVGSPFLLNWIQRRFRESLDATAHALLGASARTRLEVDPRVSLSTRSIEPERAAGHGSGSPGSPVAASAVQRTRRRFRDLVDFVEGNCNRLALAAARQVCEAPGESINPVYVHGGVGVGKTHLLEGVYKQVRRRFPALSVVYLTAEHFTNFFTQALRDHTLPSFRQRFRHIDVLLVDDVDFFDSKRVIQEEFLHTIRELESHGRQIVLTGDRHPRLLSKLSEELTTRFLAGLVCRIEPPEFETRRAIVDRKSRRLSAPISGPALTHVARRFSNSVRELEGALNCLQAYHSLTNEKIGLSVARRVLADLERDCIRMVGLSDIEQAVCTMFGLKPDALKSAAKTRSVTQPRMLAMFLARKHTRAAYSEIGQYFGGRNHSTVISAERRVRHWLDDHSAISVACAPWPVAEVVESLEQQLLAG